MTPLKIGIAGLGTVGQGTVRLLSENASLIGQRAGRDVEIGAVCARDRNKERDIDISGFRWIDDPLEFANDPDIDVVVELIGGDSGVALELTEAALDSGKSVVSANKALLANRGYALACQSAKTGACLYYEAAIAGGIPIVKTLREGLAGNKITTIAGILNGTSNYILTRMEESGAEFDEILKEAQDKGYAEADPEFDIEGIDAAHKLALLVALAFGVKPDLKALPASGIKAISQEDIQNAATLGYKIKLLGIAQKTSAGISQKVGPALVPYDHPLSKVEGVLNAVYVTGDFVHSSFSVGPGAGKEPTASAVVADIIDIARDNKREILGVAPGDLAKPFWVSQDEIERRYYIRLPVLDKPGVLSDISGILKKYDISVETLIQIGRDPDQPVSIVMTSHEAKGGEITKACSDISTLEACLGHPCIIPIETIT